MNKSTCHGCGARIVFIKMVSGKYMPCDPAPVYYVRDSRGKDVIVLGCGITVSGSIVKDPSRPCDVGYRPHWATCPKAKSFKRGDTVNGE